MITEKLQKVLAHAGFGSRRQIEGWIKQGRLSVNRQRATLGTRINSTDEIRLDGRQIRRKVNEDLQVLCYHKVLGEICTRRDPAGRPTIFQRLPKLARGRWIAVGRLDISTMGLLLVTSEGELAHRLMHPSYQIEREYAVRVLGKVDEAMLKRLTTGVELAEGLARFKRLVIVGGQGVNHWYHVVLTEGRHREVRRLWESQGVTVSRLIRVRFGPIALPRRLKAGHYQALNKEEIQRLLQQVDLI